MAEWSKAPRLGRGPQGREFEPHYRHEMVLKLRFLIEYIQNDFVRLGTGDSSVSRALDCRKYYRMVLGSILSPPELSNAYDYFLYIVLLKLQAKKLDWHHQILLRVISFNIHNVAKLHNLHDDMAEWSKAPRLGRGPQGREFEPHYCHEMVLRLRFLIEYIQNAFSAWHR